MSKQFNYQPVVNFDKTVWTIWSLESFYRLIEILKILFKQIDIPGGTPSFPGHNMARLYKNGTNFLTLYYRPKKNSEPNIRLVFKPIRDASFSGFPVIEKYLQKKKYIVTMSRNESCLNIKFPEDANATSSVKHFKKHFEKVMQDDELRKELIDNLDIILTKLGYELVSDSPDSWSGKIGQ